MAGKHDSPLHGKLFRDGTELVGKILQVQLESIQFPLDAGQIEALLACLVLLEMQNVSAVTEKKSAMVASSPFWSGH